MAYIYAFFGIVIGSFTGEITLGYLIQGFRTTTHGRTMIPFECFVRILNNTSS